MFKLSIIWSLIVLIVVILIMALFTTCVDAAEYPWKKMNNTLLQNVITSEGCGDNVVIGLDENKNGIIDRCYELKYADDALFFRVVNMYYHIYDKITLTKQGCVCA